MIRVGYGESIMKINKYDGACVQCGIDVAAGAGRLTGRRGAWKTWCADCEPVAPARGTHTGWFDTPLAALDFETTGVNPHHDRIVSYACLDAADAQDPSGDGLCGLINPGIPVSTAAQKIHRIEPEQLADAPGGQEVIGSLIEWIDRIISAGTGLVVCNAPFDLTMLHAEADRYGVDQPDWDRLLVVDPLIMDWGVSDGEIRPRKLPDLCRFYQVVLTEAHDARSDAIAARGVAVELGRRDEGIGSVDLAELIDKQRQWFAAKAEDWNVYARSRGRSLDDPHGWPLALS